MSRTVCVGLIFYHPPAGVLAIEIRPQRARFFCHVCLSNPPTTEGVAEKSEIYIVSLGWLGGASNSPPILDYVGMSPAVTVSIGTYFMGYFLFSDAVLVRAGMIN